MIQKPLEAIKALVISFYPNDSTFSFSMQEKELYKSINLTQGLTDVFTTVGETAYKAGIPVCFFIDEIQYMKPKELGSLTDEQSRNAIEKEIEYSCVENSTEEFYKLLDVGFFKVRYERCADSDKKFIFAMVQCGELPCTISNVAKNLNKSVNSVSTTRVSSIYFSDLYFSKS